MQLDPGMRPWSSAHHSLDRVHVASAPHLAPPWLAQVQSPRGLPAGPDCPPHCPHIGASAAITGPCVGPAVGPSVGAALGAALGAVGTCAGSNERLHYCHSTACFGSLHWVFTEPAEPRAAGDLHMFHSVLQQHQPIATQRRAAQFTSVLTAVRMQAHGQHCAGIDTGGRKEVPLWGLQRRLAWLWALQLV